MKKVLTKKNILILGGTGFIGYHILKKAKKLRWNLTSISKNYPKKKRFIKGVNYILLDVSKKKELEKRIRGKFNYIINLIGESESAVLQKNNKKILQKYYLNSKNLINFFSKSKIDKFLHIGSSAEYGKIKIPHNEVAKCKPISNYGKSKLKATKYLLKKSKKDKFPAIIVRLFQVYGPNQNKNIISVLIKNCRRNLKFNLTHGNQTRDFCFIDDVVDAIFLVLNSKSKKVVGKIFNIGLGKSYSIKHVTKLVKNQIKKGIPVFGKFNFKKEEILHSVASIKKIYNTLGWKPKYNLNKGILKTISINEK